MMSSLVGLVVAFVVFGGLELIWRSLGLPLSVIGALGAVVRQTDVPRLQRRQALTMLLLVTGGGMLVVAAVLLAHQVYTRLVFSSLGGGIFVLTLAGHVGGRTMRAIAKHAAQSQPKVAEQSPSSSGGKR